MGKTTQAKLLADSLEKFEINVIRTREPGGVKKAEALRSLLLQDGWDPIAELLLYLAARKEHVEKLIKPALSQGIWVVCDRFGDSTYAYQGQNLGKGKIDALNELVLGDFKPDITFLLDLEPEIALERARKRGGGKEENAGLEFHRALRSSYLELAALEPERWRIIPAQGNEEEIRQRIIMVLQNEGRVKCQ